MKAAVYRTYGPPEVVTCEDIPAPVLRPEDGKRLLIRVHAASMNPFDVLYRSGFLPIRFDQGWFRPKLPVLGIDVAGTVIAAGPEVTRFKVGDAVYGGCFGAHAEVVRAREDALAPLPQALSYEEAAALPTVAMTALQGLRDSAGLRAGQTVLVNGAAGGVGHVAVQIAKALGAEVTAVCSGPNLGWVQALGADHVIDYTRDDFTRAGKRYDVIYDAVGKRGYLESTRALKPDGVVVLENPLKVRSQLLQLGWSALRGDRRAKMHLANANANDLAAISNLCETGQLRPVIERVYPLDHTADAHRHVERGHTQGKVVIGVQA